MQQAENQKLAALSAKIKSFPSLPSVVNHVLEVTADPKSTVEDLIDAISPDLALNTAILKISNSAFFGQMRQVSSLKQALMTIGFSEVQNIVLSKAVFNSFKKLPSNSSFEINKFWEHSFLCGLASKMIAMDLSEDGNELFVAGLIHDVGKLVIQMAMPNDFHAIIRESEPTPMNTLNAEKKIIGTTHDRIGMSLLTRWMFPEKLIKAVGFHHQPEKAGEKRLFPTIVHVANFLSHAIQTQQKKETLKNNNLEDEFLKITQIGKLNHIDFSQGVLNRYLKNLAIQKEEQQNILTMFLS